MPFATGLSIIIPEILKINSVGIFFDQEHEIEIEGRDLSSDMTVNVGSFVARIKTVSSDGTSATILTPEIPETPNMTHVEVYASLTGRSSDSVSLKISKRPPSFQDLVNTGENSFTTTTGVDISEPDLGIATGEQSQVLKKIFLNTPEGTIDDLSKEDEKREYAVEQISKYLKKTKNIEDEEKVFKDHVTEAYVYDYENKDPHIRKTMATNFYVRKFEEALETRNLLELPFYYMENINTEPYFRTLSQVSVSAGQTLTEDRAEIRRNRFYSNWKFSQKLRKQVFFSKIPEPNNLGHFPKYFSLEIDLEPAINNGINSIVNTEAGITEEQYDNFCLKYIAERSNAENKKVALISSNEEFDTQNTTVYSIESLYSGGDEQKVYEDIAIITEQSVPSRGWSEDNKPASWGKNYRKTIEEEDKIELEEHFRQINAGIAERKYRDIMAGVPAPSEPFLYELIKQDNNFRRINTFYFPARHYHSQGGTPTLKFNDTQILHGLEYKYTLIVHRIVYGESYRFIEQEIEQPLGAEVDIAKRYQVQAERDCVIMPIELATLSASSISRPGLSPEVKTVPQKNKGGMPKFFIQSRFGKNSYENYSSLYVPLTQEEIYNSSSISDSYVENGVLEAYSKFPSKYFEVFRRDVAPLSIYDFAGSRIAKVSPSYIDDITYGTGATFEDSIEKNKKYYYLFRSVDAFGTPGVPLGPFEYEIINDGSSYFTNFKSYDMTSESPPSQNMSFRRMIKISPHPRELNIPINDELQDLPSATTPYPILPLSTLLWKKMKRQSNFWNKKYKFRIVSKKTGRKIDINFTPNLTSP